MTDPETGPAADEDFLLEYHGGFWRRHARAVVLAALIVLMVGGATAWEFAAANSSPAASGLAASPAPTSAFTTPERPPRQPHRPQRAQTHAEPDAHADGHVVQEPGRPRADPQRRGRPSPGGLRSHHWCGAHRAPRHDADPPRTWPALSSLRALKPAGSSLGNQREYLCRRQPHLW